jgi:hypothetical protein
MLHGPRDRISALTERRALIQPLRPQPDAAGVSLVHGDRLGG